MSIKALGEYHIGETIYHIEFGTGVITGIHQDVEVLHWKVNFENAGEKTIRITVDQLAGPLAGPGEIRHTVSTDYLKQAIREVLSDELDLDDLPIGEKWSDGILKFVPGKEGMHEKEIPIHAFFHKIVMVRDRLRVLEQRINTHPKLSDEEKVQMQQYITRIYGSLTSFNVFFRDRSDWFIGEQGSA